MNFILSICVLHSPISICIDFLINVIEKNNKIITNLGDRGSHSLARVSFLFLLTCLIHARMPDWGWAFVHGHTFLHSWSGPMTLVVGLLHGATFLSNLPIVLLLVSFRCP